MNVFSDCSFNGLMANATMTCIKPIDIISGLLTIITILICYHRITILIEHIKNKNILLTLFYVLYVCSCIKTVFLFINILIPTYLCISSIIDVRARTCWLENIFV